MLIALVAGGQDPWRDWVLRVSHDSLSRYGGTGRPSGGE
jgi:hypothetical protein